MDQDEARNQADRLMSALFSPMQVNLDCPLPSRMPQNLAEWVLLTGKVGPMALMISQLFALDPEGAEFAAAVMGNLGDLKQATNWLAERFVNEVEDPAKLNDAIDNAKMRLQNPGFARREILPHLDQMLPKGPPGRPSKIRLEDWPAFLNEIDSMSHLAQSALQLHRVSKGQLSKCAEILRDQYPDKAHLVLDDLEFVEREIQRLIQPERKHRDGVIKAKLAAALAGRKRNMEPTYSQSIAEQARRRHRDLKKNL